MPRICRQPISAKRYEAPDREFYEMNSDCIKSAKELPL